MLKLVTRGPLGTPTLWVGLTKENVARLADGKPLRPISLSELGVGTGQVAIFAGDDHEDLQRQLREAGIELPDVPEPGPGQTVIHRPDQAN